MGLTVSVIIPCYNLGEYLSSCLESISLQNCSRVEYIFVNDGSTDETLEKLKFFCGGRQDCILIDSENMGVSHARNLAINIATGDYLYFLDGDDVLQANAMNEMVHLIDKRHPDIIIPQAIFLSDEGFKKLQNLDNKLYTPDELYSSLKSFPTMPQNVYRRDLMNTYSIRLNETLKVGEIYEMTLRYLTVCQTVLIVDNCFFTYIIRSGSVTHKPKYETDESVLRTLMEYYKHGQRFESYPSFHVTAFKILMAFTYNKYIKLGIKEKRAQDVIRHVLNNNIAKICLHRVACLRGVPLKERVLAIYTLLGGINGFRLFVTRK